jgi:hypothetical protein
VRRGKWADLCRAVDRAWLRVAGIFSERHRLAADLVAAVERGEGATLLTWHCDELGEPDRSIEEVLREVDEAVRRAPSPLGADEFLLRVAVYTTIPDKERSGRSEDPGRELLEMHTEMLDRYYDWLRGDALDRLRQRLEKRVPCPDKPFVAVAVLPLGGAVAALLRDGPWQPASPWLR